MPRCASGCRATLRPGREKVGFRAWSVHVEATIIGSKIARHMFTYAEFVGLAFRAAPVIAGIRIQYDQEPILIWVKPES